MDAFRCLCTSDRIREETSVWFWHLDSLDWIEIQPLFQLSTLVSSRHVMTQVSEESAICGLSCVPFNRRSFSLSRVDALYHSIREQFSRLKYTLNLLFPTWNLYKPSNSKFPVSPELWFTIPVSLKLTTMNTQKKMLGGLCLNVFLMQRVVKFHAWKFNFWIHTHCKSFKLVCHLTVWIA